MRLVFVTQRVDPEDPVLGATVAKLRALAASCDEVVVLTDAAVSGALPENCVVRPFGARTKAGRGARFEVALARELARRPRPAAVVAHMCPIYAVLAAPLARPLGVPCILWYTHFQRTRVLRLAATLVNAVASVDQRSVPIRSRKVVAIGHGIDLRDFSCSGGAGADGTLRLLALGRYAEPKGLAVVIRGVARARAAGVDVTLAAHGRASTPSELDELARLRGVVAELALDDAVELGGPVPRVAVPDLLRTAAGLVNNMRAGAADKVVLEAGASCLPVLASNPSFRPLLSGLAVPLLFERDDPDSLAERIGGLAELTPGARLELGRTIRERVEAGHSVDTWAERMLAIAAP